MELTRVASCKCSFLSARIYTEFPQNPAAFNLPEEAAVHYLTPPQEDWKKQDGTMAADLRNVAWKLGTASEWTWLRSPVIKEAWRTIISALLLPGYLGISEVSLVRMVNLGFPHQGNEF